MNIFKKKIIRENNKETDHEDNKSKGGQVCQRNFQMN